MQRKEYKRKRIMKHGRTENQGLTIGHIFSSKQETAERYQHIQAYFTPILNWFMKKGKGY